MYGWADRALAQLPPDQGNVLRVQLHVHFLLGTYPQRLLCLSGSRCPQEEREALYLWMRVSKALDTLCNAHYTPKALGQSDLKCTVIKAPALRMEEATPTAVSNAQMLTPEELYNMPGKRSHLAFKSQEELTRHDRAVLRRTVKSSVCTRVSLGGSLSNRMRRMPCSLPGWHTH